MKQFAQKSAAALAAVLIMSATFVPVLTAPPAPAFVAAATPAPALA